MRTAKGFTIFELLVVVVIASVVAAVAVPSLRETMVNSRVSSAASDIDSLLAFAKSEAASPRVRGNIVITTTANAWQVRQSTNPVGITGTIIKSYQFNPALVITTKTSATSPGVAGNIVNFQFTPTGLLQRMDTVPASAVALTIQVCDSGFTMERGHTLSVNQRGRVLTRRDTARSGTGSCQP